MTLSLIKICNRDEFCYAEWRALVIVMLSVIFLNVIMLSVIMLSVIAECHNAESQYA